MTTRVDRAAIIILSSLKENSAVRLSDLASDLLLDISTVSRQAKALEDRGLVTRTDDLDDRRAVRLELTPAGLRGARPGVVAAQPVARRRRCTTGRPRTASALVAMLTRFADSLSAEPAPNRPKTETSA